MKRGELILVWIAGLWTIVAIILAGSPGVSWPFDIPQPGSHVYETAGYFAKVFKVAVPGWILCGLMWATLYRRRP